MNPATRQTVFSALLLCLVLALTVASSAQATLNVLYTFAGQRDVAWPESPLTFDRQGNLYGTSLAFGPHGYGTVFKLSPAASGWTESIIYAFCSVSPACSDGAYPEAGVVFDPGGNLYGTASEGGGALGWGTVYKLAPSGQTWTETVLCELSCLGDSYPAAEVTLDPAGRVFTTLNGNPVFGGLGDVLQLAPDSQGGWNPRVIHFFQAKSDGSHPSTALILDKAHNLYGMTSIGGTGNSGGTVFELSPAANGQWSGKTIFNLPLVLGATQGGLTMDSLGNLYGAAGGMVFELSPAGSTWIESVLYLFADGEGGHLSRLVLGKDASLYGTAGNGGNPGCENGLGCGSAYKLTPTGTGWAKTTLYQFTGGADGGNPNGGLVMNQAGHLFGVAKIGGDTNLCQGLGCGVGYEIIP